MNIAIDARFWGLENTGLGRYTMQLITHLLDIDKQNHYSLITKSDSQSHITKILNNHPTAQYSLHTLDSKHYTFSEQIKLPQLLNKINPDIFHSPHFNIPIFWKGRQIVTIHDLIKQASVGAKTTTLPLPFYWVKYLVHNQVIRQAIQNSVQIIVPSNYTKQQILQKYSTNSSKIHITAEAPDNIYYQKEQPLPDNLKKLTQKKLLVYIGNTYPHKNLPRLIKAIAILNNPDIHLAIISSRNLFQADLKKQIAQTKLQSQIHFLEFIPDSQVRDLYRNSHAFITPSLIEGFGLPGLEAMAAGTLILSSNTTCLPEIYGEIPTFFDPLNPSDIAQKIQSSLKTTPQKRATQISQGKTHSQKYTWKSMAGTTLKIYEQSLI